MRSATQLFGVGNAVITPGPALERFADTLDSLRRQGVISHVRVIGAASPDGPEANNARLSQARAESLAGYLRTQTGLPETAVTAISVGEDWETLAELIPTIFEETDAEALLGVIREISSVDERESRIKAMSGGRLWRRLTTDAFPQLRRCTMAVHLTSGEALEYQIDSAGEITIVDKTPEAEEEPVEPVSEPEPLPESTTEPISAPIPVQNPPVPASASEPEPKEAVESYWYLKSNLPAWVMLWANLSAEIDCAPHWSLAGSIYYSGWNYFARTTKFRTFTIMPEARYWLQESNNGAFFDVHAGLAYYNVAFGGEVRYQDHNRSTPTIGGGLGAGYRIDLNGKDGRFKLEFTIGVGVYPLNYDKFENRKNGPIIGQEKKTFFGIDNLAVSLVYRFEKNKKESREGARR